MTLVSENIISCVNNGVLELQYLCKTSHVTYSISDFGGNVMKRGDYNCLENNTLFIEELPKGFYTLCIIDGDQLIKNRFQKF
ncbi:MAG: hypothetical protein NTX97_00850 [Bacteroidetes bacterium]|nr:hypothetical protein [Bacteroidota bacterium]